MEVLSRVPVLVAYVSERSRHLKYVLKPVNWAGGVRVTKHDEQNKIKNVGERVLEMSLPRNDPVCVYA